MPDAVELLILVLAAYRLTRLAGWDDFPLAAKVRARAIGEEWVPADQPEDEDSDVVSLPGKTPSSEVDWVRPAYRRPTLAHLVHCPFCVGFWISLAVWVAWALWPDVIWGLAPLAISGAVGLTAKVLDA
jgi:hypothetical protein